MADKKKKRVITTYTTGSIPYNISQFNKRMGSKFPGNDNNNPTPIEYDPNIDMTDLGAANFYANVNAGNTECSSGNCDGGSMGESLNEATVFAPKIERQVEIPDNIKLIPQDKVNAVIATLDPEEMFTVGYVTPIYFYKELLDKINIIKCSEFEGYTGLDYRVATPTLGKADALDDAAMQSADPNGTTDYGDLFNKENDMVKTGHLGLRKKYDQINKTVHQSGKFDRTDEKNQIEMKDLQTILFYAKPNSKPKIIYYIDFKDGSGFVDCPREFLANRIYDMILNTMPDKGALAIKARDKALKIIENDSKTTNETTLSSGEDRDAYENSIIRPSVRALYTNQIYYLKTNRETIGAPLNENLTTEALTEETKRYIKRYYIRPQNIVCSNKEEILKALVEIGNENCSVYSLKNLADHDDVHLLTNKDIIYYYDNGILYDKNHVKVMDYELGPKHEEERKKVNDIDDLSSKEFSNMYDDRLTDADITTDSTIKVKEDLTEDAYYDYDYEESTDLDYKNAYLNMDEFMEDVDDETQDRFYQIDNVDDMFGYLYAHIIDEDLLQEYAGPNATLEGFAEFIINNKLNNDSIDETLIDNLPVPVTQESEEDLDEGIIFSDKAIRCQVKDLLNDPEKKIILNRLQAGRDGNGPYRLSDEELEVLQDEYIYYEDDGDCYYARFEKPTAEIRKILNLSPQSDNPFDLYFESVNAYGERLTEDLDDEVCCICGEPLDGYGNNPAPYKEDGRCCDACNIKFVIPARIELMTKREKAN